MPSQKKESVRKTKGSIRWFMEQTMIRLVAYSSIDDLGKLDNTLVMYVIGDNGSSAEVV